MMKLGSSSMEDPSRSLHIAVSQTLEKPPSKAAQQILERFRRSFNAFDGKSAVKMPFEFN
jgi:uncharacterized membrane protein